MRRSVSIIIPTYNEENDIRRTLAAVIHLDYPNKEIIVVDDSTDNTPNIVKEYEKDGVRLVSGPRIAGERNSGIGAARNIGISEARGDILIFFNADNLPEPDYIRRLLPHYETGAGYVFGTTRVANEDRVFARFIGALGRYCYEGHDWLEWEDGFSCRRDAAIEVGMFPVLPIPLYAGEDGAFGARLGSKYRKVIDSSIVVPHIAPQGLREYWAMRKARARGTANFKFFIAGHSLTRVFFRVLAGTLGFGAEVLLVLPVLLRSWGVARYSPRGRADLIPFWYAYSLHLLARVVGEWQGFWELCRNKELRSRFRTQYLDEVITRCFQTSARRVPVWKRW